MLIKKIGINRYQIKNILFNTVYKVKPSTTRKIIKSIKRILEVRT